MPAGSAPPAPPAPPRPPRPPAPPAAPAAPAGAFGKLGSGRVSPGRSLRCPPAPPPKPPPPTPPPPPPPRARCIPAGPSRIALRAMVIVAVGIVPSFSIESSAATVRRACTIVSRSAAGESAGAGAALPRKFHVTRCTPGPPGPVSVGSVSPVASCTTMRACPVPCVRRYQMSAPYCGLGAWKSFCPRIAAVHRRLAPLERRARREEVRRLRPRPSASSAGAARCPRSRRSARACRRSARGRADGS